MYFFCYYFLLFFIYCLVGYVIECIFCSIISKKIVLNRGFLIGPYLPIYGSGAMCIIVLLRKYLDDPLVVFVMASLIATGLEYFTSYIMEKIFKARWWDYSEKKFNINGRVCLENSVLFGLGSIIIMYIVNPFFENILRALPEVLIIVLGLVFFIIYITDTLVSISIIYNLRKSSIAISKDSTKEISEQVLQFLKNNVKLNKRLLNAFPKTKTHEFYDRVREILNK